ncbi:MAG: tetratricopeptide repeat protein [bacterium]|jgi:MSHA biogenesis protein MshN|nr:tetratricopeptide repeat protein [Betaproteobacteria bacterium]
MSVINQMLLDLERRHAGPEDRRALPDEVRPLPAATDRALARRIGGWTLAVAGAGAVAWLLAAGRIEVPAVDVLGARLLSGGVPAGEAASEQAAGPVSGAMPPAMADERAARPERTDRTERSARPTRTEAPQAAESADPADRPRAAGPRQAQRDAANAETDRLVRDAAGATVAQPAMPAAAAAVAGAQPGVPLAAQPGPQAAPRTVSPVVAASFASGSPPPAGAIATPFVTPPVPAAAPTLPAALVRPVDTSPARIDRQEREPSMRERAEATYRRGVEAMHEGRMPAAEQALREALAQFPAHEAARQTLLGILVQQRRNVDAEALLVEGQRQNPAQTGFALALARLQAERGDTAAALDSLQRSAAAGRDRPEFLGFQAGLLARAGRHADAVVQYRAALRLVPQNAVWWMGLGISLESDRRPSEAAEAFQRARETPGLNAELTAYVDQRLRSLQR